jgi:hypothetical protein
MGKKETPIQRAILDYLTLKGHKAVRINTQGVPLHGVGQEGKFRPSPNKGVADILVCTKYGSFAAIEVKSETGKLTIEQADFMKQIMLRGGLAVVARSVEDVIKAGL